MNRVREALDQLVHIQADMIDRDEMIEALELADAIRLLREECDADPG